ncbi:MAG: hypothetical protein WED07_15270 [Candidatus Freyarchaeum deiterrae]
MSEITVAITGISLFLYAFKLCEYFEIEAEKAIKRSKDLVRWYEDSETNWENKDSEIEDAIKSQKKVIKFYISPKSLSMRGRRTLINGRILWIYLPIVLLLLSFGFAIWQTYLMSNVALQLFPLSDLIWESRFIWLSNLVWLSYPLGVVLPVIGAAIGMSGRPTTNYLNVKDKYNSHKQTIPQPHNLKKAEPKLKTKNKKKEKKEETKTII